MDCKLPEEVENDILGGPGLGGTWRNAIIEIYEPEAGWPKEGTPATWIEERKVLWCDGLEEDVILHCPLWKVLWWKAKNEAIEVYWWVRYYAWDKWRPSKWGEFVKEHKVEVVDEKSPELDKREGK